MGFPDGDVMDWLQKSTGLNLTSVNDVMAWEAAENNMSLLGSASGGGWYADTVTAGDAPAMHRPRRPPPFGPYHDDPFVVLFQTIAIRLNLYGTPTSCAVGLLGNLVAALVLLHSELWRMSAARYLLAVLVTDGAFLVNLLIGWLSDVQGVGVYAYGGLCHFTIFLSHGSCFLAIWYLVCFGVDGYIRLCFRRRRDTMCTTTRANVVILALMAVAIAVFINISITFGVTSHGPVLQCRPLPLFITTLQTLFKIDIFLNSMLPDVLLIYLMCHALVACICGGGGDASGKRISCCSCCCYCCSSATSTSSRGSDIRVAQERTDLSLEGDFRRLYFLYILVSLCLNVCSHLPRVYYTIHGLLYPNKPLTMKDFMWQQVLIHAYNLRCTINILIFLCASKNFRGVCCAAVVSFGRCVARLRQRRNPSGRAEIVNHTASGTEQDDTVTALMKETAANSTTAV